MTGPLGAAAFLALALPSAAASPQKRPAGIPILPLAQILESKGIASKETSGVTIFPLRALTSPSSRYTVSVIRIRGGISFQAKKPSEVAEGLLFLIKGKMAWSPTAKDTPLKEFSQGHLSLAPGGTQSHVKCLEESILLQVHRLSRPGDAGTARASQRVDTHALLDDPVPPYRRKQLAKGRYLEAELLQLLGKPDFSFMHLSSDTLLFIMKGSLTVVHPTGRNTTREGSLLRIGRGIRFGIEAQGGGASVLLVTIAL